jgi:hypothetical protein
MLSMRHGAAPANAAYYIRNATKGKLMTPLQNPSASIMRKVGGFALALALMLTISLQGSSEISPSLARSPLCYNNPNVPAYQVNSTDFFLADLNRLLFYSVWPNDFYTFDNQGAVGYFNTNLPGPFFPHPINPKNIIGTVSGDAVSVNFSGAVSGFPLLSQNALYFSSDGGKTWGTTFLPTSSLSQSATASFFYSADGRRIYALGFFQDTYTNPSQLFDFTYYTSYLPHPYGPYTPYSPTGLIVENSPSVLVSRNTGPTDTNTVNAVSLASYGVTGTANPAAGLFICESLDGGRTFSQPVLISATQTESLFGFLEGGSPGPIAGINGLVDGGGALIIDPSNPKILNVLWTRIDNVSFLWGSMYNSRSTDGGKTWTSNPTGDNSLINITNSPIYALEFDQNFLNQYANTDADYATNFPNYGQAVVTGTAVVSNVGQGGNGGNPVYICGTNREYPQPGLRPPSFTDSPADSFFDHAVIISKNKGKTWGDGVTFGTSKVNGVQVASYIFASAHDPRFPPPGLSLIVVDGALNQSLAASPKTGRVYYAWEGGNFNISSDPLVNQFYPEIQLSVSSGSLDEIGQNWTTPIKANQTPDDFIYNATSQAFNPNVAVNKDGIVGVIYSDFRNFDLTQVGDSEGTVLTTTWLSFYQELASPTDGPFGNGLDFIGEIQVSPVFDSTLSGGTPFTGITTGTFLSISTDVLGNFIIAYPVSNENNFAFSPIPTVPFFNPYSNSSYNIVENTNNRNNTFVKVIPPPCVN